MQIVWSRCIAEGTWDINIVDETWNNIQNNIARGTWDTNIAEGTWKINTQQKGPKSISDAEINKKILVLIFHQRIYLKKHHQELKTNQRRTT